MIQYAIWMASGSTSWVLQLFSHEPLGTSNTLRLATHRRSLAAVDRPYPTRPSSWSTFIGSDAERDAVSFNVSLCSRFLNIFFRFGHHPAVCRSRFKFLSCSCHTVKVSTSLRWRWPSIVERLTGSPHSAVSRTAIAQPASANALRYVKIIDHN